MIYGKGWGGGGVTLYWTLYPIAYPDYESTVERIKILGEGKIHIFVQGDSTGEGKSSWKIPFDMKKTSERYDWLFCRLHKDNHNMLIVRDGTIRTCFAVRLFENLENRFGNRMTDKFKNCGKSAENYLRLSNIQSEEEIVQFMRKRIALCDYCALRERHSLEEWMPSRGDMTEWFIE